MARLGQLRSAFLIAAVALLLNVCAAQVAQEQAGGPTAPAAPLPPATTENPIVTGPGNANPTTPLPNPKPQRRRAISPDVAAQLSAVAPKFTPSAPKPPPVPEEEQADLRDIDKPRNGIIRLPKYIVREKAPPVLNERTIYTQKGLADLAVRRYIREGDRALNALTAPLFGSSLESRAMAMYAEDERLRNMSELEDTARMISATDKASGLYVKRQVESMYTRPGSFDWRPIGR